MPKGFLVGDWKRGFENHGFFSGGFRGGGYLKAESTEKKSAQEHKA